MAVRHWDDQALERLGKLLQVRRVELDPRYHSRKLFAGDAGINLRRVADLENGRRGGAPPLTLKTLFAPAYKITYESMLDVLNHDGDLVALPGSPPHKPPRALRLAPGPAPGEDDASPVVAAMLDTPGIDEYLEELDRELGRPRWEPRDQAETRIWLDRNMREPAKRAMVAFRRLTLDQRAAEGENAGLRRSQYAEM